MIDRGVRGSPPKKDKAEDRRVRGRRGSHARAPFFLCRKPPTPCGSSWASSGRLAREVSFFRRGVS